MAGRSTLTDAEYQAFMHSLVGGAINGMWQVGSGFDAQEPGKYPPIDDAMLVEVAALLAATALEANPDYRASSTFDGVATMVRDMTLERLKHVRSISEATGKPLLYRQIEKAIGQPGAMNDR